ncbi:hypothetical protein HNO88_001599 [Novosphingobium chloroacetimidivorans]|uniref:Uncharacterized protein n=1 Tax=Novosphingobium chloroacetimidivorans TaxID=1428314 RepID=A0A7W7K8N1_9SPHN|nr:hypothetical protein [Novosphingobium chloroacetimidivorans]MBB4858280.1 hypothetical protein [Novosphingobium chloroacetimidivorans]
MSNRSARLDRWVQSQRERWFAEGFKAAREQAAKVILVVAESEDWRPEDARMAGVKAGRAVRMLHRAANHVRNMPRQKLPPPHATKDLAPLPQPAASEEAVT